MWGGAPSSRSRRPRDPPAAEFRYHQGTMSDGNPPDAPPLASPFTSPLGTSSSSSSSSYTEDDPRAALAAIVESSDDAIIGKDLNGVITSWNRGAERIYGYSAAEMIGHSISILIPRDKIDEFSGILERIRAGERVAHHETQRLTKDGRLIDVSLTVSPIAGAAGRIVGASAIARDISNRKRADRVALTTAERLRSIIESAVEGIIVIDSRGLIEAFNPGAERLFGYSEREVLGRNVSMLMPSPYREEHDQYIERYLRTKVPRIIGIGREVTGQRKDGSTFPAHLSVGEMSVQGERRFTGILHDLTERVRMEKQLRDQSALMKLGEMAAVVAHEVKNPLAGIRGAVQVISGRLPAGSRDAAVLDEVVARIDALNDLMKELLLFARPPQPKFAPVDFLSLLRMVVDLIRQDQAFKELEIDVAGPPTPMIADAELLRIVIQNLLINSAHAMQGRGRIEISVTPGHGTLSVAIADHGPGIPRDVQDKLFTPFFTTKSRGTGLGLSTARRFVEVHGGTMTVRCPDGGGTIVTIQLPMEPLIQPQPSIQVPAGG